MRKLRLVIKFLLLAACVLVAVLGMNTWRFTSQQVEIDPLPVRELDQGPILERLRLALRHRTISYQNPARVDETAFKEFHSFLESAFPKVYERLECLTGDQLGDERNLSLLFKWPGRNPKAEAVLLMAHCDVVPVESETVSIWTHAPFEGADDGQFIWGRGALDAKDGVMGLLEAVELLLADGAQPDRTVYLSIGHDEEVGGTHGNQRIAEWMQQHGIRLQFVLDEGGCIFSGLPGIGQPVALVGVAEKGYLSLRLVAELPVGGHSSVPPADTAIGLLAKAISRLEDNPFPRRLDGGVGATLDYLGPEMPLPRRMVLANRWMFSGLVKRTFGATSTGNASLRTTLATTMIEGGVKENVLPLRAQAMVNIRILPGDCVEAVLDRVRSTVRDQRISIEPVEPYRNPSRISMTDSDGFETIQETIAEVFPDVLVAPCVLVAATDSAHFAEIARDIYRFLPARLEQTDLPRIHGTDERIGRENYLEVVRFYVRLIQNCAM